jgi:hypothetical protein
LTNSSSILNAYFSESTSFLNGTLYADEIPTSAALVDFTYNLRYVPDAEQTFSVIYGSHCSLTFYDSAIYSLLTFYANGSSVTTLLPIKVCAVDSQQVPTVTYVNPLSLSSTHTPFNLTIVDFNDQAGQVDGLWSTYSAHLVNGTLQTGAGIRFIDTATSLGNVTECTPPYTTLQANVTLEHESFCFFPNGRNGSTLLSFSALDGALGSSDIYTLTLTTRSFLAADTVNIVEEEEESGDLSFDVTAASLFYAPYGIVVQTLPQYGTLSVSIGVVTYGAITYTPQTGYFNRYRYADDTTSFTFDSGEPLRPCGNASCPDTFTFSAYSSRDGFVTESNVALFSLYVDRRIVEVMGVCDSALLENWGADPCTSLGAKDTDFIPLLLTGSDGRIVPDYIVVITSLPQFGTLYYNVGQGEDFVAGDALIVGSTLDTPTDSVGNVLYVPDPGYVNRILYDTTPTGTLSVINETGSPFFNCPSYSALDPLTCTDSFTYYVQSGFNSSLQSEEGTYTLFVAIEDTSNLLVCGRESYSLWGTPCVSHGYENNDLFDLVPIPIYFDVNFTLGEVTTLQITVRPAFGDLYLNAGDDYSFEFGAQLQPIQHITLNSNAAVPLLLYVGNPDYFNAIVGQDDPTEYFIDLNGNPLGSCPFARYEGCLDTFTFQATTASGRVSNVGTYFVTVASRESNASFVAPDQLLFELNTTLNFTGDRQISVVDPDGDVYEVGVQIQLIYGAVFYNGSLEGITLDKPTQVCFILGCRDFIQFYGVPSAIQRVFDGLLFTCNETLTSLDDFYIYISLIKKFPYGVTPANAFIEQSTDFVLNNDILIYSVYNGLIPDDYYEDIYVSNTTDFDSCDTVPDDYGCDEANCTGEKYYREQNECLESRFWNTIYFAIIIIESFVILGITLSYCFTRSCCNCTRCQKLAQVHIKEEQVPLLSQNE